MEFTSIFDYVDSVDFTTIGGDEAYGKGQIGGLLREKNDVATADFVIVGCNEHRGDVLHKNNTGTHAIRQKFYQLFHWHTDVRIADIGDVQNGKRLNDSYAALELVLTELLAAGKKVLVLGGSHDNTLAIYNAFAAKKQIVEATVIDALIDIDPEGIKPAQRFLLEMLIGQPNYIRQFNLLGFQSYFTNPALLEAIDKLRFDCVRVGKVQEKMEEVEPIIRSSEFLSFDLKSMAHAYLPVNELSPNGFTGQDACKLMQFAGMSNTLQVAGIFGLANDDAQGMSAMQVAQMVWYFMDGIQKSKHEADLENREGFTEYHTLCAEVDTVFLQSRHTGRWWMQMPDKSFAACSFSDYAAASHNDIPERWLRIQERD